MKNDAKFGMLAGVLGVIVAAVLFAKSPPSAPAPPGASTAPAKGKAAPTTATASTPAPVPAAVPEANTAALPSTPVARTRKDVEGQSTSLQADEEP